MNTYIIRTALEHLIAYSDYDADHKEQARRVLDGLERLTVDEANHRRHMRLAWANTSEAEKESMLQELNAHRELLQAKGSSGG